MKQLFPLICLSASLFLCSCGSKQVSELPVIDVNRSYPSKELILQDIADVEYIPLETKEGFLIGEDLRVQYMDEEVIVTNNKEEILFFDRKSGKSLYSFRRYGRGPGEYLSIHSIAVDRKNNELFVTEGSFSSDRNPVYVYDLQGKYLRTLEYHNIGFAMHFHNYNDDYLFWYNQKTEDPFPYKLMSKTNTVFTQLPVEFAGRDKMSITQNRENGGIITISPDGNVLLKIPGGYIFSEPGLDTVYRWETATGKLIPLLARTPSFHSMEFPIGVFITGESSEYLFIRTIERKFDFEAYSGFTSVYLIHDKKEGIFYEGLLLNGDYVDREVFTVNSRVAVPVGTNVIGLQAWKLMEAYENNKLRGKLAEVASTLKEDDNPVVLIATFK